MSEPRRVGLMELLASSTGCQFVIPVYQRNYTWNADREVRQFLKDLECVLKGEYKNHFLGILIYLEKSIDFATREFSIIDGQQRLTTTFLTIYAVRQMMMKNGDDASVKQLEGQYLTNPFHTDKIKYKLKPLVSDDNVYKCIVEDRISEVEKTDSNILKNFNYICSYLDGLVSSGYTPNDILLALNKLYVVCVPVSEEDNAQKIFESINATGVKLTGADLIRNYLLMNLSSETQDRFYACYWKKIEDNVSSDSKNLEMFFRMYLAVKTYSLVPKNSVYRFFVDYVEDGHDNTEELFKELLKYAKVLKAITYSDISSLSTEIQNSIADFRKINSDVPLSCVMEFYRLFSEHTIDSSSFAHVLNTVNSFMIRRSICDMDSQNISKLFPTTLKKVLDTCSGDYSNLDSVFDQELVGNNADTSGSYMPTDSQMHSFLHDANVYKRPALRIILDRLELNDNPAPVDLSSLSIEHLMPQTPSEEWLEELDTDEETYYSNLHRLGNLTLAAKADNSKMSNLKWDFKNKVLESTAHLKLNMELLPVKRWTLECIEKRTNELIGRICQVYPYPEVSVVSKSSKEIVDELNARVSVVSSLFSSGQFNVIEKNSIYKSANGEKGYILFASKMYPEGDSEKYWYGYRERRFEKVSDCPEQYFVLICRGATLLTLVIPRKVIDDYKDNLNNSADESGAIKHYHIVIHKEPDGKVTLLLSKPSLKRIDITDFVV